MEAYASVWWTMFRDRGRMSRGKWKEAGKSFLVASGIYGAWIDPKNLPFIVEAEKL